jgi:hypothetical protein
MDEGNENLVYKSTCDRNNCSVLRHCAETASTDPFIRRLDAQFRDEVTSADACLQGLLSE